jgi:hypothetical protein
VWFSASITYLDCMAIFLEIKIYTRLLITRLVHHLQRLLIFRRLLKMFEENGYFLQIQHFFFF